MFGELGGKRHDTSPVNVSMVHFGEHLTPNAKRFSLFGLWRVLSKVSNDRRQLRKPCYSIIRSRFRAPASVGRLQPFHIVDSPHPAKERLNSFHDSLIYRGNFNAEIQADAISTVTAVSERSFAVAKPCDIFGMQFCFHVNSMIVFRLKDKGFSSSLQRTPLSFILSFFSRASRRWICSESCLRIAIGKRTISTSSRMIR